MLVLIFSYMSVVRINGAYWYHMYFKIMNSYHGQISFSDWQGFYSFCSFNMTDERIETNWSSIFSEINESQTIEFPKKIKNIDNNYFHLNISKVFCLNDQTEKAFSFSIDFSDLKGEKDKLGLFAQQQQQQKFYLLIFFWKASKKTEFGKTYLGKIKSGKTKFRTNKSGTSRSWKT